MMSNFFTSNNEDRIAFVEFIQDNKDVLENLLNKQRQQLKVEDEKFKYPHNQKQKLTDTLLFSEKKRKFRHVENSFNYFITMNLGDDPVIGELLYDLDDDEIRDDGFMENPERRKQIKEFEKWLNTEDVKKVLAKNTLKKLIKKHHIQQLKENMDVLSVRPMGVLSEKDPGGITFQETLGKWEARTMATHDKRVGGKKRICKDKVKITKKKNSKRYSKTRRFKQSKKLKRSNDFI